MIEIRFDKTKDEVALLIWFLVDHSVFWHLHYFCVFLNADLNKKLSLKCSLLFTFKTVKNFQIAH
jgi:hypothetical protein